MPENISVIIPTLNEAHKLEACVKALGSRQCFELIVVDGGSSDDTVKIARDLKALVLTTDACRACQMNLGAGIASYEILLFLHADTILPVEWIQVVHQTLQIPGTSVGAFKFSLDECCWQFTIIENLANLRSRFFQMPYGDQAIFVSREHFYKIGAFPEIWIMEDFVFCKTARKLGHVRTASSRATTSGRRWRQRGILRTTLLNQLIIAFFTFGVSDKTLRRLYDSLR